MCFQTLPTNVVRFRKNCFDFLDGGVQYVATQPRGLVIEVGGWKMNIKKENNGSLATENWRSDMVSVNHMCFQTLPTNVVRFRKDCKRWLFGCGELEEGYGERGSYVFSNIAYQCRAVSKDFL